VSVGTHNKAKWFSGSVKRGEEDTITQMPQTPKIIGRHWSAASLGEEEVEKKIKANDPTSNIGRPRPTNTQGRENSK
jgi:hypothetical protein